MNNGNGKRLYSLREAREILCLGDTKMRSLVASMKISHSRVPNDTGEKQRYRFTTEDLDAYVDSLKRVEAI